MPLRDLAGWLLDDPTFQARYGRVVVESAQSELPSDARFTAPEGEPPEWSYLLFVASILANAGDETLVGTAAHEAALRIAQHCLNRPAPPEQLDFDTPSHDGHPTEAQRAAAANVLDTLANTPALALATRRHFLPEQLGARLPMPVRIEQMRRHIEHAVSLWDDTSLAVNRFQRRFWTEVEASEWVSFSAPTSAGKSFIVTHWLIDFVRRHPGATVVYLVPTRALIGQVEGELQGLVRTLGLGDVAVSSMPLQRSVVAGRANVFVLTQERLHILLTAVPALLVDLLVVDEAHKVGDGHRGVLLQQVIERVTAEHPRVRVIFASPMTSNPDALVIDAPENSRRAFRSAEVTVSQNLLWVSQLARYPRRWSVSLRRPNGLVPLGELNLTATPDGETKRLAYVAHAMAGGAPGTVVYVNRAYDAERVAILLYGLRGAASDASRDPRLAPLIDLVKRTVHTEFSLGTVLERGVAFHYGNLPLLIRTEIERLFSEGVLHFLVCTSTLIEGVNMSCRTMVMRGPKKGIGQRMSGEDFWNLAGRAGRWGKEFQGNVVCVDPTVSSVWGPELAPTERSLYAIRRTTDTVVAAPDALLSFIAAGTPRDAAKARPELEFVFAYLAVQHRRRGTIRDLPWVRRLPEETIALVEEAVGGAVADLRTPLELMERNPGISPLAMDALLARMARPGRDPASLLPVDPASEAAYQVYTEIFTRIGATLNVALGHNSRRSSALALLVTRWMRGFPLSRLIQDRIDWHATRERPAATATVIRTVLGEVENIARFEAPRSLACYVDLLRVYLRSVEREDLAAQVFDLGLMLEFGVSRTSQISFIGLGLSRTSAIALNELLTEDELSEEGALRWLAEGVWRVAPMPVLVKLEVERVLLLHMPEMSTERRITG